MSFPSVAAGTEGGAAMLARIALSGSVRTREDAENFRNAILTGGYEDGGPHQGWQSGGYFRLYRAVLALLGDMSALRLPEPDYGIAMGYYRQMKKWYINNSECRCLRTPSGAVAVPLTTCPVHGETPGAKPGFRNLNGLMR